jgi:hypothetical protein
MPLSQAEVSYKKRNSAPTFPLSLIHAHFSHVMTQKEDWVEFALSRLPNHKPNKLLLFEIFSVNSAML